MSGSLDRSESLVVALMGLPGAGKSTLARALEEALGLSVVDRDRIRRELFPDCRFSEAEKQAATEGVLRAVQSNCRQGNASVVAMPFSARSKVEGSLAAAEGAAFLPLFLDCPAELAAQRVAGDLEEGGHPAGDRDPELVRRVAARFEPPPPDVVQIDATRPAEVLCRDAIAAISKHL